ncbi:hypothetical protein IHE45_16G051200 [Dioscorea alata]|uniref:Uncharacterized protein n=1 Tax=Dioscorea alata TaxID=55571 RepID=A0ACB7UHK7_DIOAL|nr:hypothetical protein IHE45_16G051200 [Dioscorea alata]
MAATVISEKIKIKRKEMEKKWEVLRRKTWRSSKGARRRDGLAWC